MGKLIAFDGIDGSGKSTQLRCLSRFLERHGHEVVTSKEPTSGTPQGRRLQMPDRLPPEEELAHLIADRQEHVRRIVQPALDAGKIVLLDRYYLSTVGYQGATVESMEALFPKPDLGIVLDVPVKNALARIMQRGQRPSAFEGPEALREARDRFRAIQRDYVVTIDAEQSPDDVMGDVVWHVGRVL